MSGYGYGVVRPLSETMDALGLSPKKAAPGKLNESKKTDDRTEKTKLVEAARTTVKKDARVAPAKSSSKDGLLKLVEEVEAIEASMKSADPVPAPAKAEDTKENDLSGVVEGLSHITKFSDMILKKFEWRSTEPAKLVTELFKSIKTEADSQVAKIKGGQISEASVARIECDKLAKRFVEAVGHVKASIPVNKEVFDKLIAHLKDVK